MHLFICTLCSIPFTCMSTLTQVAHSLDYCNFVVSFENEKCASYNMFFFYNIVYTILCLLNFHMNLRISSNFCKNKKSAGILTGIALNLQISLGGIVVVQSLSHVWLFYDPMDCSPPGSSVHGISQARILKWVPFPSKRSQPNNQTGISCNAGRFLTTEPPGKPLESITILKISNLPIHEQESLSIFLKS